MLYEITQYVRTRAKAKAMAEKVGGSWRQLAVPYTEDGVEFGFVVEWTMLDEEAQV